MKSRLKSERTKTSISIRHDLWRNFSAEAVRAGCDRSRMLEYLLERFLGLPPARRNELFEQLQSPPLTPVIHAEANTEITALLEWYQKPPSPLDQRLKAFLRERLEELKATAS